MVGYGKELNYPGYLGQCMVGRVSEKVYERSSKL